MQPIVHSQHDLDSYFADMEHLLSRERPEPGRFGSHCIACGCTSIVYSSCTSSHPGSAVCDRCGAVQHSSVYWNFMYGATIPVKTSNYKRIHHWHERISQLLLQESQIPHGQLLQIARLLCDGSHKVINKDVIRAVLRSLNMQQYIEKWLQIIQRITHVSPPTPGPMLVQQLDALFLELQRPFEACELPKRKNFLNYNYVFCRLFQKLNCMQFCMFFPLIKSRSKLRALDEMWYQMVDLLGWPATELQAVAPFAVRLEAPQLLLQRLEQSVELPSAVATHREPLKKEFRMWGHCREADLLPPQEQLRSSLPAPGLQRLGLLKKRLRCRRAVLLR